ncbi:MAG: hypothetical protein ABH835_02370 [Patescibacteria group bacterium]
MKRFNLFLVIGLVGLIIIGGLVYFYFFKPKEEPPSYFELDREKLNASQEREVSEEVIQSLTVPQSDNQPEENQVFEEIIKKLTAPSSN